MNRSNHSRAESRKSRMGIAATEFAVCLPILMVILIGTIEACSMIYLKQTLSVAAYEGARASLRPGANPNKVTNACNRILNPRKVNGATITITPANFKNQPAETWITVRVAATGGGNSVISGWFYDTLIVDGEATMMKEF